MRAALPFCASFAASFLLSSLIVQLGRQGRRFGIDDDLAHPRKLHGQPIPRIGGIGLIVATGIGAALSGPPSIPAVASFLLLLACALPCFAGGLLDDLTAGVHPYGRLAWMAVSAAMALTLAGVRITRTDVELLDTLIAHPWASGALTGLGLLTITNGINLIDGLNGLAGGVCLAMFSGLAIVGHLVGDPLVAGASLAIGGAVCGFLAWNFPGGRLFLGDGGAYLLGFMLGSLSILLVARNPGVSAWFAPLLLAYPLTEVSFSVWRRRAHPTRKVSTADAAHLHHLVYRRVVGQAGGASSSGRRNALATIHLWALSSIAVLPAVLFHDNTPVLIGFLLLFVASYLWLYRRIARLRVPRWLNRRDHCR